MISIVSLRFYDVQWKNVIERAPEDPLYHCGDLEMSVIRVGISVNLVPVLIEHEVGVLVRVPRLDDDEVCLRITCRTVVVPAENLHLCVLVLVLHVIRHRNASPVL
jgi:hypothetical protein